MSKKRREAEAKVLARQAAERGGFPVTNVAHATTTASGVLVTLTILIPNQELH